MFNSVSALYRLYQQHPSVTTDTRHVKPGDLFFALRGENFNGNEFALKAVEAGAAFAVVDDASLAPHPQLLPVENVLETLQQLALHHRRQFSIPFVAITGSNGKTTTKELTHAVLSTAYATSTTEGNLNNHIGIPLTLLKIPYNAQIAVIEMGANHQKEIESYCRYTEPTHGLITNCGKAHLEGFGGVEGVRKGKGELFDYLRAHGGSAWACADFDYFKSMTRGLQTVAWYGMKDGELRGRILSSDPLLHIELTWKGERFEIKSQLVGAYNAYNILAAASIGLSFGISIADIARATESYEPENSRSQLIERNGNTYILDAYNANPSSMQLAIENLARQPHPHKMLFLGGMKELGEATEPEHEALLNLIKAHTWEQVVLVGPEFEKIHGDFLHFDTALQAGDWWLHQQKKGRLILIKGSRGIAMERMLPNN